MARGGGVGGCSSTLSLRTRCRSAVGTCRLRASQTAEPNRSAEPQSRTAEPNRAKPQSHAEESWERAPCTHACIHPRAQPQREHPSLRGSHPPAYITVGFPSLRRRSLCASPLSRNPRLAAENVFLRHSFCCETPGSRQREDTARSEVERLRAELTAQMSAAADEATLLQRKLHETARA